MTGRVRTAPGGRLRGARSAFGEPTGIPRPGRIGAHAEVEQPMGCSISKHECPFIDDTASTPRAEKRGAEKSEARRRFAPHQLRHAHAVEMAREGVPLIVIQRQLGHTNLGITSI